MGSSSLAHVVADRAGARAAATLRFLVVDDDPINRKVLVALLRGDSYVALEAADGAAAVSIFEREQPDMVLMDVMMPGMDGYEATRRIKQLAGRRFVPVIFLTALQGDAVLARCIEAGGEDFLSKPFQRIVLRAKIEALLRTRALYTALEHSHAQIQEHHRRIQDEQAVAERLFNKIVHRGCLDAPNIRYLISPAALFNGDLLLAARRPDGVLRVMLGDFAGHGLPAAVGAIPVSEIFYVMTAKGHSVGEVVSEINRKLNNVLPAGQFLAAAIADVDHNSRSLTIWNGGVPDVLVRGPNGVLQRLSSHHLPLGVVGNEALDSAVERFAMEAGSRVLMYSDGVIDVRDVTGLRFGQPFLESIVTASPEPFGALRDALIVHRANGSADDDITLIEINVDVVATESEATAVQAAGFPPAEWRVTLELGADALRGVDPLPACLHMALELQGLHAHREHLYMILAELFTNALDHGLLGLDSTLKHTPQGFARYYKVREQALSALGAGKIRVTLAHQPEGNGGRLSVEVEDSGQGYQGGTIATLEKNTRPSGRGLSLVRSLCREVIVHGCGNRIEAIYECRP